MCRARPGREKYELNLVRSITKTKNVFQPSRIKDLPGSAAKCRSKTRATDQHTLKLFIDSLKDIGALHGILAVGCQDVWPPGGRADC